MWTQSPMTLSQLRREDAAAEAKEKQQDKKTLGRLSLQNYARKRICFNSPMDTNSDVIVPNEDALEWSKDDEHK
ncbi:MAG: hypothetical protein NVS9B5_32800 [Terriglobales bacterium]